jgi:serine/threonine-protein kinase
MGVVHETWDPVMGRDVALKIVRPDRRGRQLEARFVNEACVQGQLDHPNVVPVFDVGRDETGCPFFTMRRVSGITLDEIVRRSKNGDAQIITTFGRHRVTSSRRT